jgi:hypothetical protein
MVLLLLVFLPITSNSKTEDIYRGFSLGTSFKEAEKHANANGWNLEQFSQLVPGQWHVEGTNVGLFTCEGIVASISAEHDSVSFEEFVGLVTKMKRENGKPDIQIIDFNIAEKIVSSIDVEFSTKDGVIKIQLQSIGGNKTLTQLHSKNSLCVKTENK